MKFELKQIGSIKQKSGEFIIQLEPEFRPALTGIDGFSWLNIIWWAHNFDLEEYRSILVAEQPYKNGPEKLGIFATRSPLRPNLIAVTPVFISRIDFEAGALYTPYIDAEEGTPVLDIKPYHGCSDRPAGWKTPSWCADWPRTVEESASFDWEKVFNF